MNTTTSILWRRLDRPGHDACRLEQFEDGACLHGMAVFQHERGPASLAYSIDCDAEWKTIAGKVQGFLGDRGIDYRIARRGEAWTINGVSVPGIEHLVDLDLGFTPATNIVPLRRVAIGEGQSVQLPAAWFDVDAGTLTELPQIYERRGEAAFWYQSPSVGYQALLEIAPSGFVRRYPELWEAETFD